MRPFGWYRTLMRNPRYRWMVIVASLVYLVSPIDLSPDVIPIIGQIDDVIIVTLLFSEVFQRLLGAASLTDQEDGETGYAQSSQRSASSRRSYAQSDSDSQTVDVKAVSVDD
ncbi:MAG: YkvA family protein [Elainellaceae cyanobacterium]